MLQLDTMRLHIIFATGDAFEGVPRLTDMATGMQQAACLCWSYMLSVWEKNNLLKVRTHRLATLLLIARLER